MDAAATVRNAKQRCNPHAGAANITTARDVTPGTKGRIMMTWERAKEIGTHGGCGWLALAVIRRRGGVPMIRYGRDGTAKHAAVRLDGQLIHLGDDEEGFQEVTFDELRRACREDFDPGFVAIAVGEVKRVVELMKLWEREE